jgi:hypothetical protein
LVEFLKKDPKGVSWKDLSEVLAVYDALLDGLGFSARLRVDEFHRSAKYAGEYACSVEICASQAEKRGRLLCMGSGRTQQEAREEALRLMHAEYGFPPAFSAAEAKLRIETVGEESFRPACGKADSYAKEFSGRW